MVESVVAALGDKEVLAATVAVSAMEQAEMEDMVSGKAGEEEPDY